MKPNALYLKIPFDLNVRDVLKLLYKRTTAPFYFPWEDSLEISPDRMSYFLSEAKNHDRHLLTPNRESILLKSSGEQKKALIKHTLKQKFKGLVCYNLLDNLDQQFCFDLESSLSKKAEEVFILQIESGDNPPLRFTKDFWEYNENHFKKTQIPISPKVQQTWAALPQPIQPISNEINTLIKVENLNVAFEDKSVLKDICWQVKKGEFWQLIGPNGSGKSTLLNLIIGDSHKGYGQRLELFGRQKGSGESVWDIKSKIGYFTPLSSETYQGYATVLEMVTAGFYDAVGLYVKPHDQALKKAKEWLILLGMEKKSEQQYRKLNPGEKRLVMVARAMVKHPPLLILDEPLIGLDTPHKIKLADMVNQYARQTNAAIILVTHKVQELFEASKKLELYPGINGSIGKTSNF